MRGAWRRPAEPPAVEQAVREIIDEVRRDGDAAVLRLTARFDRAELRPDELRVASPELEGSLGVLEPALLGALRTAIANVDAVARAQLSEPVRAELPEGQRVEVAEVPVRRAGIYVPSGRAPYLSTVVMGAVTARAAGVEQVAVCAPPGPAGRAHPAILAACVLCEVHEVYRMGGAQAVAALAYGTASVPAVDVIAGPGNAYVREAKRQVAGTVGIDGLAGPSELVVIAAAGADPDVVALDLLAQAEHGADSPLWVICADEGLLGAEIVAAVEPRGRAPERHRRRAPGDRRGEHARGPLARGRDRAGAPRGWSGPRPRRSRRACDAPGACSSGPARVPPSATSSQARPTCSRRAAPHASRAGSPRPPSRRRMARVSLPGDAPGRLAPAGATLARAEGFPVHAESMERRA